MIFVWLGLGIAGIFLLVFIYDKITWYQAKFEEAKRGTVIIAEHMKLLRECLLYAPGPDKDELEEIFTSIQINNARSAYILGGIKLLEKVSNVRPTPVKKKEALKEDVLVEVTAETVSSDNALPTNKGKNKKSHAKKTDN